MTSHRIHFSVLLHDFLTQICIFHLKIKIEKAKNFPKNIFIEFIFILISILIELPTLLWLFKKFSPNVSRILSAIKMKWGGMLEIVESRTKLLISMVILIQRENNKYLEFSWKSGRSNN
jgi:DNA integrity scanning protein DisA with diadenylate cyclase activity